ncbi:hypothetical protein N7U66_06450 [Lacinutrix neustonica]|uniref:Uncharacterized protein n=1 Tax=Lacinutrix neustonica TaxID=2980107 RepID=A0A9E8SI00_9FLAO|nr:hypothetical protein [Lacinutrix neustonica]WAC03215.1 hypothetical protein N7U66_06450 [Lacinutrix neustonica]
MKITNSPRFKYTFLGLTMLLLIGCKAVLAAKYDAIIIENLDTSTTETFAFIASVSNGTDSNTFMERADTYNAIIGAFETLELQAGARPLPKNKASEKINAILNTRGKPSLSRDYLSAFAFKRIAENIKK